ncbi:MAG: hypothetical protein JW836_12170, partial [Deltaproteobacteria bacterium]|nr:hypothetical protein [Deltaproteobacteria bacterium]
MSTGISTADECRYVMVGVDDRRCATQSWAGGAEKNFAPMPYTVFASAEMIYYNVQHATDGLGRSPQKLITAGESCKVFRSH